ncbi:hypothetical protein M758_5G081200 [Ceratodon purpureus]|nr:hypothetical protein M758_5G081200 [Ceratodon purpureus]
MAAASHQFLTRPFNVIAASFASKLPSRLGFVSQLRVTICQAPLQKVASDAIGISRRLNNRIRVPTTGKGRALHPAIAMAETPLSPGLSDTIVLEAKGEHKVTVVFLHGLASSGERWAEVLTSFNQFHPSIKWILPTAPFRKVDLTGEFCNACKCRNVLLVYDFVWLWLGFVLQDECLPLIYGCFL